MKKQDLIEQFKLPKYIKGKSFADASKAIEAKFEGLNDKAAKDTKQALMQRLADMQEYVKAQQAPPQQYAQPGQQIDPTQMAMMQEQMFLGGMLGGEDKASFMEASGQANKAAGVDDYLQGAGTVFQAGNSIFGKTGIDTTGRTGNLQKFDTAGSTVGSTLQGAAAGAQIGGPLGAAIGGAVGLTGGLIGGKRKNDDIKEANKNFDIASGMSKVTNFAMGGNMDCGNPGQPPCDDGKLKNISDKQLNNLNDETGIGFDRSVADRLFGTPTNQQMADLDLGKYKDVGYFNVKKNENRGGYNIVPTSKNPQNAKGYMTQLNEIKKLNPGVDLIENSYVDFQNRKALGGFTNNCGGPGQPPCNEVDGIDYTVDPTLDNNKSKFRNLDTIQKNPEGLTFVQPTEMVTKPFELKGGYKATATSNGKGQGNQLEKADLSGLANFGKNALRYAPALMNAFQLANMEKPEVETRQKLDSKYDPQLIDEERIQRSIAANQGNTSRALQNVANGSKGFVAANMLGSDINTSKAIGQAAVQAQAQNDAQMQYAQQFNRQADQFNISQDNLEQDLTDRNKGVYDTNKSALLGQIGNDLGAIGKEELFKQYPVMMGMNYKWNGEYFVNDKGDKKTKEEAAAIEAKGNQSSMGGYQSTFSDHMNMLMNPKKK